MKPAQNSGANTMLRAQQLEKTFQRVHCCLGAPTDDLPNAASLKLGVGSGLGFILIQLLAWASRLDRRALSAGRASLIVHRSRVAHALRFHGCGKPLGGKAAGIPV